LRCDAMRRLFPARSVWSIAFRTFPLRTAQHSIAPCLIPALSIFACTPNIPC
jgi:hypothetical protein